MVKLLFGGKGLTPFKQLNYDIIVIIILIGFITYALYFRFKRQLFFTISFLLPFVILYFSFNLIVKAAKQSGFLGIIAKILPFSSNQMFPATLTLAIIIYLLLYIILRLIFLLFREPIDKQILNKNNIYLKFANLGMCILNSYVTVVLLLFMFCSVIKIDYNRPITSVVMKTSNQVITVSFVHDMMLKAENYNLYKEAMDQLSGRQVQKDFSEIKIYLDEVDSINNDFNSCVYPLLSNESKDLIADYLIDDNYIACLLHEEEESILNRIIVFEESNPIITELNALNHHMNEHLGYWHLFCSLRIEDIAFDDFFTVIRFVSDNIDNLAIKFTDPTNKINFKKSVGNFDFFLEYYYDFISEEPEDIDDYTQTIMQIFSDKNNLLTYAENFIARNNQSNHPIINKIIKTFKHLLKYELTINNKIPLDINITYASNYKIWFKTDNWRKHSVCKAYLLDAITDSDHTGYNLYHRYFFYRYLDNQATLTLSNIINALEMTINQKILSEAEVTDYMTALIISPDSLIHDLERENRLIENFYNDISTSNHRFISDKVKQYLS